MKKKIGISILVIVMVIAVFCLVSGRNKAPDHNAEPNAPQKIKNTNCTVTFDANGMDISDLPEPQEINKGGYVTEPKVPTCKDHFFIGWHTSPDAVAFVDAPIVFDEYSVEKDTTLYAIWESKAIDMDGDGLDHQEEERYGTDAYALDTDLDGVSDGDEVNTHKTDPLDPDSDDDGIVDGVEISLKLDPLNAMSDNTTEDIHRRIETTIQDDDQLFILKICALPAVLSSFSADTLPLSLLEDPEGLISPIIQVEYDGTKAFDSAQLTFDYSGVDLKGIDEDDLTFLYLNEKTGLYELVPSTINKQEKTIRCDPTHFSCYVVGSSATHDRTLSAEKSSLKEYLGDSIKPVVTTNYDVRQHGYAFHNFQYHDNGGNCYGFAFTSYLNYIERLPLAREARQYLFEEIPEHDLSDDDRFFTDQLYIEEEKNLFTKETDYSIRIGIEAWPSALKCIAYWQVSQSAVRNRFFDNLACEENFRVLKSKLANDEPVLISLRTIGKGHFLLAYGLYRSQETPNVYYVSVYDCNYPGELRCIKVTGHGELFKTYSLEYENYTSFRLANFTIPEGPYVPHKFDVSGTAVNGTNAIAGAKVTITNEEYTTSVYTDPMGAFKFAEVPNGVYTLEITAEGYADKKMDHPITVCGKNADLGHIELTPKETVKRLTRIDVKDAYGDLKMQYIYTYDRNLLTEMTYQSYGTYAYQENTVLTYDSTGTLRSVSRKNLDDYGGTKYTFNSAGQLISRSITEGDGCTIGYEYDAQGKLIRESQKELGDTTVTEYLYDDKGVLISAVKTTSTEYFDGEEYVVVSGEPSIQTFTLHHDSHGRLTKVSSKDETSESITTYSYDYTPFVLSEYESIGQYGYKRTRFILQHDNGFELDSLYLENPEIYMDASGHVAKVVSQNDGDGTQTYVFYYDGIAAEPVDMTPPVA